MRFDLKSEKRDLTEQAADWLVELEVADEARQQEFADWLRASPEHFQAYLEISAVASLAHKQFKAEKESAVPKYERPVEPVASEPAFRNTFDSLETALMAMRAEVKARRRETAWLGLACMLLLAMPAILWILPALLGQSESLLVRIVPLSLTLLPSLVAMLIFRQSSDSLREGHEQFVTATMKLTAVRLACSVGDSTVIARVVDSLLMAGSNTVLREGEIPVALERSRRSFPDSLMGPVIDVLRASRDRSRKRSPNDANDATHASTRKTHVG